MSTFYSNVQLVKNTIYYRGYEEGVAVSFKDNFGPTLFVENKKENTKFRTLDGKIVSPMKFSSVREARNFMDRYEGVENFTVYGYDRFLYQYISDNFRGEVNYDPDLLKIYSLDIEVASENGFPDVESSSEELLCITIKDIKSKKLHSWGMNPFIHSRSDLTYKHFFREEEMIRDFLSWWSQNTPDVITGWNVYLYDIPYLIRRISRVLDESHAKGLSPWNLVNEVEVTLDYNKKQVAYDLIGISCLDYMKLYKKFTVINRASYKLDYIAGIEIDDQKVDHTEFNNFKEFYTKDWQKFVEYNIHDVELIERLDDKLKLIDLCLTMAYDAKQNFEDVFSQIKTWDNIIFNYLRTKHVVVPPKQSSVKNDQYDGAYVKQPNPGRYHWVMSLDLTSMYPSLIMQYSISPETLVTKSDILERISNLKAKNSNVNNIFKVPASSLSQEEIDKEIQVLNKLYNNSKDANTNTMLNRKFDLEYLKDLNFSMASNGSIYKRELGVFPELVQRIFSDRQLFKKKMLEEESNLVKIEAEMKSRGLL